MAPFVVVAAVRPGQLKTGKLINRILTHAGMAEAARRAANNVGRVMINRLFNRTVAGWEHKVKFLVRRRAQIGGTEVTMEITTKDEIWHWLDKGTDYRPWRSDPSDPYNPSTTPGFFDSHAHSGNLIYEPLRRGGIEARGWSESEVAKDAARAFLRLELRTQMARIQASG